MTLKLSFQQMGLMIGLTVSMAMSACSDEALQIVDPDPVPPVIEPTVAQLSIDSPAKDQRFKNRVEVTGSCNVEGARVHLEGQGIASALSTKCLNGRFAVAAELSGVDGVIQYSVIMNEVTASSSLIRDTQVTPFALQSPLSAGSYRDEVILSLDCEKDSEISINAGEGVEIASSGECGDDGHFNLTGRLIGADGPREIRANAMDDLGNEAEVSVSFFKDSLAPALTVASWNQIFWLEARVSGTCERGLPVQITSAYLNQNISDVECVDGVFEKVLSLQEGPDGVKRFEFFQVDSAGNRTSAFADIIRDTTRPVLYFGGEVYDPRIRALPPLEVRTGTALNSVDFGVRVIDDIDGDLTHRIRITNVVQRVPSYLPSSLPYQIGFLPQDLALSGDFEIAFEVADARGLTESFRRTLRVLPIDIASVEEFLAIRSNRSYRLVADLDLSQLAQYQPLDYRYGRLDGNNHTIRNLSVSGDRVGLFREIGSTVIQDLNLEGFSVEATQAGGALAARGYGIVRGLQVSNFSGRLSLVRMDDDAGMGAVIGAGYSDLVNVQASGIIQGTFQGEYLDLRGDRALGLGGLVGRGSVHMRDVSFNGQIAGQYFTVGGLVGRTGGSVVISNARTSGTFTGLEVGGLVGEALFLTDVHINNSFTNSSLFGSQVTGGLLGGVGLVRPDATVLQIRSSVIEATFPGGDGNRTGGVIGFLASNRMAVIGTRWTARPPALPFGASSSCQAECFLP
jgi:hypothetical protein